MKKHNLILVTFFSLTMATGCYNGHILDKPITMLANDKKEALTAPLNYDSSLKLHTGSPVEWGPVWTRFYNTTSIEYQDMSATYDRALFQKLNATDYKALLPLLTPIWSNNNTLNRINIELTVKNPTPISNYAGDFYEVNYGIMNMSNAIGSLSIYADNPTPYPMKIFFDISSNTGSSREVRTYLDSVNVNNVVGGFSYLLVSSLSYPLYIPPFSKIYIVGGADIIKLDALYFDILPSSQYLLDYNSEIFDNGFGNGFDEGWRSVDNLQWLENVATAVKDIFSVEIFPGFTVGFIVLFPLVIAIVKWFLSLFGIGGGS